MYLTPDEVAQILRVSQRTVLRMAHSGRLPSVRVGRLVRVPKERFEDWLRSLEDVPIGTEHGRRPDF